MPLQTGFAQNWMKATGEIITGFEFYPAIDPAGKVASDDSELARDRRIDGSDVLLPPIAAARRTIDIANPYFVPDQVPSIYSSPRTAAASKCA